jgi:hypothetical protein
MRSVCVWIKRCRGKFARHGAQAVQTAGLTPLAMKFHLRADLCRNHNVLAFSAQISAENTPAQQLLRRQYVFRFRKKPSSI